MNVNEFTIDVEFKVIDGWIDGHIEYALVEVSIGSAPASLYLFNVNELS